MTIARVDIRPADFAASADREAVVQLLDHYARDPFGGGRGLPEAVRRALPDRLAAWPGAVVLLARLEERPVGVLTCFPVLSTFRAAPRWNVHDLAVHRELRGRGIGRQLLAELCQRARRSGAAQVTLEVRRDNARARRLYASLGFSGVGPEPAAEDMLFGVLDLEPTS